MNMKFPVEAHSVEVYFDGGFRQGIGAACAAYVNPKIFTSRSLTGHANSHIAEVQGARDALTLTLAMIRENPQLTVVTIRGDNHDCVMTLATNTEELRAVPGKSQCPGAWRHIMTLRSEINEFLTSHDRQIEIRYEWIPRRMNAFADHLCTCKINSVKPSFEGCQHIEPPRSYSQPTLEDLAAIADRVMHGRLRRPWKSIPAALRIPWHAVLGQVAAWENPWALLLAPAVLLQRHGDMPAQRLQRLATQPGLVEMYFWHAAHGDESLPTEKHQIERASLAKNDVAVTRIERLAAHSPARALKVMFGEPPSDATNPHVRKSVESKFPAVETQGLPQAAPCRKPNWINREVIIKIAATRLARAAAPGPDGWTRELLLASFCKPTLALFEAMVNAIASDTVPPFAAALLRSARLAAWAKREGSTDQRVVGMTSTVTKVVWKILTAQHLATHNVARNIATFSKGGAIGVIRWAEKAYLAGTPVCMGDIVDAYWNVDRCALMNRLVKINSPLTFMFAMIYGSPATCMFGDAPLLSRTGVIPGCGGGSILFTLDEQRLTHETFADPSVSAFYADDLTTLGCDAFNAGARALHPKALAKIRVVSKDKRGIPSDMRTSIVPAVRLLGGYIGETNAARKLFEEDIMERLRKLGAVTIATVNTQTKWALIKTIELGIRWKFAASNVAITNAIAAEVDDKIAKAVFSIAEGEPSHKSRTLVTTPVASGGLGLMAYALHSDLIFNAATVRSAWPPTQLKEDEKGVIEQGVTPKQLLRDIAEKQVAIAVDQLGFHEIKTRSSSTTPWFNIPAITKKLTIANDAFTLAFGNYLRCNAKYDVCSAHDPTKRSTSDHSQTCHRCAAPYRYARHNITIAAFRSVCSSYGISTSENFYGTFGITNAQKRPDVIVYRGATSEQPLVLDFAIPHQSENEAYDSINIMWNAKKKKYQEWLDDQVTVSPFIIGTNTVPHASTLAIMQEIEKQAIRKGFLRDCMARMKLAIVNFEVYRKKAIAARKMANTLDFINEPSDRDDADDD